MSIEAMAMAGLDYRECGVNFEEWDRHCHEQPPLYLQIEQSLCREMGNKNKVHVESMKEKLREWAKAVSSEQQSVFHIINKKYTVVS